MTKLFFDTEFTGLHQQTTLISLGIIAETGQTFYAEFTDYDTNQLNSWLTEHVISQLGKTKENSVSGTDHVVVIGTTREIVYSLKTWLQQFDQVEMWSDCLHYDWVLFVNLFGTAFDVPSKIYYIPFDICTLFKVKGIDPDISREQFCGISFGPKHYAIWDAFIIERCYNRLINL